MVTPDDTVEIAVGDSVSAAEIVGGEVFAVTLSAEDVARSGAGAGPGHGAGKSCGNASAKVPVMVAAWRVPAVVTNSALAALAFQGSDPADQGSSSAAVKYFAPVRPVTAAPKLD